MNDLKVLASAQFLTEQKMVAAAIQAVENCGKAPPQITIQVPLIFHIRESAPNLPFK